MSLPRLALGRPVATAMLFLAVLLLGAVSFSRMPVALLPEIAYPRLVVWTAAPEVGPAEVERLVTEPVEEALSAVPGVQELESVSREGQSIVTLAFPWGTDMEFAQLHVRERLDHEADRLPARAGRPTILRLDPGAQPILIASATAAPGSGTTPSELEGLARTVFRRRLEQLDGVGRAAVVGGSEREIQVLVDPMRLEAPGLSIDDVSAALAAANASAPGGTVRRGRYRYTLRALGEFTNLEQIAGTVVGRATGGGTIRIADVAAVRDTVAERESSAYMNGRPSIGLLVYKESGANTVAAAEAAERTLAELEEEVRGVRLAVVTSQSRFISAAIGNVVLALVLGGILAFLVLFPFLRDPRWPLAIAAAIPISVVGAFVLLYFSGVALDVMSLGGLALGVGMLVDNSIVVLENVFRHRERGMGSAAAAVLGAEEVQGAITASTLTTIAVFGPILYVEGIAGELFEELALAVAFSLLASLLVALTILPIAAARFGTSHGSSGATAAGAPRRGDRPGRAAGGLARGLDAFDRGFRRFAIRYERALGWSLDHRRQVLAWTGIAFLVAVLVGRALPREVLPEVDRRTFTVRLELPPGTPLDRTEALALEIDRWLRKQDADAAVLTRVGRASAAEITPAEVSGRHTAVLDVRLGLGGDPADALAARLRRAFATLPAGALAVETGSAAALGGLLGQEKVDLAVEIRGADLDSMAAVASEVARRLETLPILADVGTTIEAGAPEIRLALDRDAIARHGLEVGSVVRELAARTHGVVATEFADFDRRVPIVVLPEAPLRENVERLLAGAVDSVPLRLLVDVDETTAPVAIRREGQRRIAIVTADASGAGLSQAIGAVEKALDGVQPPAGIELAIGGGGEDLRRSFRALGSAFLLALLLVYLILAARFESLAQPFVVLFAVPLALVGAVGALFVAGKALDTMSLIGIVVLVGIAVNDAIVKVDFINQARARGAGLREAIEEAGRARLRPIVMTSATTVLGLLPLAVGLGAGAELRAPLAVAVIGGMISSTALTLLVVPVLYSLVAGWRGERLARVAAARGRGADR